MNMTNEMETAAGEKTREKILEDIELLDLLIKNPTQEVEESCLIYDMSGGYAMRYNPEVIKILERNGIEYPEGFGRGEELKAITLLTDARFTLASKVAILPNEQS